MERKKQEEKQEIEGGGASDAELMCIGSRRCQSQPLLNTEDYLNHLLSNYATDPHLVFPFIGWRIWKARNDLDFQGKKWSIPDIIHKAFNDHCLWTEARNQDSNESNQLIKEPIVHQDQMINYYCYIDGSWVDENSRGGIG
ncbi:hypothetical protein DY000_02062707 [Brassica cretica]|uniref:RNase H type-1 domain-containing protein n=1 Tax=Brassica cretica TaxID=69181 RepID=A0ABQ7B006_BRACR|nr:hypothetical protein DY000_02062707 [Brassica cretica]